MRPEILDRLVCAKHLFLLRSESLDRGGPYAAGLAVLTFQDSVEMLLRTIAEHFHAPIKDQASFNQVLDDVETTCNHSLTHRSALIQLNRSRVNFKHLGLAPRDEDARKFRNDLEGFFPSVLKATVDLRFDELSMASLVRHRRTANWLRKAEQFLSAGEFESSIDASAVAFAVFQRSQRERSHGSSLESILRDAEPRGRSSERIHPGVYRLAEAVEKKIDKFRDQLELVSRGIDYDQYRRFVDLTPSVSMVMAGLLHIESWRRRDVCSYENALFCSSFATKTLLKLQEAYQPRDFFKAPATARFRVTQKGSIVVWPDDQSGEVIREVELGEELVGGNEILDQPGYVAIVQDDECAYLPTDCVARIDT